jgi:DNA-binding NtrC family response regulator
MIAVNCGAIPANLVESALFGHERAPSPGAFERKIGRSRKPMAAPCSSTKSARCRSTRRSNCCACSSRARSSRSARAIPAEVDVRVIAATNKTLIDEVEAGRFREDLYYRLNVVQVTIPPLARTPGDIPALARHLLARIAQQPGLRSLGITDDALAARPYDWPGNVRQLQNALFRAAVLCDGDALTRADFPQIARQADAHLMPTGCRATGGGCGGRRRRHLFRADGNLRALEEIEADVIRLAIGHYRGRMTEVARRLGIGRSTLLPQARRARDRRRGLIDRTIFEIPDATD